MSWEGKSLVISGRTKGVSSNLRHSSTWGQRWRALQLSLQLPGNNGWEYGLRDAMSIMAEQGLYVVPPQSTYLSNFIPCVVGAKKGVQTRHGQRCVKESTELATRLE